MPAERRIIFDRRDGRGLAALLSGGALQDLLIEGDGVGPQPGEIWAARVDQKAGRGAGGGCFLDLGAALAEFAGHGGFVIRTAAAGCDDEALRMEAATLVAEAQAVADADAGPPRRLRDGPSLADRAMRLWPGAARDSNPDGLTRHGLEEAFAGLFAPRVDLRGSGLVGAWMACERVTALTAIDVNAAASRSLQAVNLAALDEIPRQLRLRGWGGQIAIDLAGADHRTPDAPIRRIYLEALERRADAALKPLGFGPLGLLEARRKRDRPPIETQLSTPTDAA